EEDRNFAEDLVARVEQLSHAFVRLCELSNEHFVISEEIRRGQPHPNAIDLSKVSPSLLKRDQDWRAEVEMITSFAHYELKSVVDMLKQWGVNVDKPELLYIAKTRDRFLSHPQSGGVMRKPRRSISIPYDGGPVEGSIAGLNSWGPISREQYLQFLNLAPPIDEEGERRTNEQLCLSHKRNEQFSEPEVVRLKAFGLREPNLTKALAELSDLLQTDALPKIDALYEQAVNVFGFERYN
ncbi:MAG TPA: hypothetical protein VE863_02105, partial [Pyrinomonadaceae bacterium]|nr:hypothetical protein [Pyrinomonadaceae bacterium]